MHIIRLIILLFISIQTVGQSVTVFDLLRSERKKADKYFRKKEYASAASVYSAILTKQPDDQNVILQLARTNKLLTRYKESVLLYLQVKDSSLLTRHDIHSIADMLVSSKPEEARYWHERNLRDNPTDKKSKNTIEQIDNISELYEDSLCYTVLPTNINSKDHDFATSILNNQLIFLSSRPHTAFIKKVNAMDHTAFLEVYSADWFGKDSLGEPKKFSKAINSSLHEGPVTFFKRGNNIIFTRTNPKSGNLALYSASRGSNGSEWGKIRSLPFSNYKYSVSHPFFDEATQTLYFVSDAPKGYGGTDLYTSKLNNGKWSSAVNLGTGINTEGNEMFPTVFNGILYFSSDGYGGLGGLDLYSTPVDSLKNPENIGYPVSSHGDDFSLILDEYGKSGFFSSNRRDGFGKDDIYYFESGKKQGIIQVQEKLNRLKVEDALIIVKENNKKVIEYKTTSSGKFTYQIKPGKNYTFECIKEGFKKVDSSFSTPDVLGSDCVFIFNLERRNKAYIKTFLKDKKGQVLKSDSLIIFNQDLKITEVVYPEEDSAFVFQVDPDYSYILSSESGRKGGFVSTGKFEKKRGSSVNYIDITADPFKVKPIKISVKDQNGAPLIDATVRLNNLVTGESSLVKTDLNGYATINCPTYQNFSINVSCTEFENELIINDLQTTPYKELKFILYD